jgi:hypothetical protein
VAEPAFDLLEDHAPHARVLEKGYDRPAYLPVRQKLDQVPFVHDGRASYSPVS